MLLDKNLIQLIEFPTWSWIVNDVLIESMLDHIYVKDPTFIIITINIINDNGINMLDITM